VLPRSDTGKYTPARARFQRLCRRGEVVSAWPTECAISPSWWRLSRTSIADEMREEHRRRVARRMTSEPYGSGAPRRPRSWFWNLRTSSAFKRQFDCAGHCSALLFWYGNHAPVSFSAIARSELIAAFAGLTPIRIKVGAAIHTVRLRVGRSLGVDLSGVRQDRHRTHRNADN